MTPVNYFAKAAAIMARVDEMGNPTLPVSKALVEQAKVYAALARAPREVAVAASALRDITARVQNGTSA